MKNRTFAFLCLILLSVGWGVFVSRSSGIDSRSEVRVSGLRLGDTIEFAKQTYPSLEKYSQRTLHSKIETWSPRRASDTGLDLIEVTSNGPVIVGVEGWSAKIGKAEFDRSSRPEQLVAVCGRPKTVKSAFNETFSMEIYRYPKWGLSVAINRETNTVDTFYLDLNDVEK